MRVAEIIYLQQKLDPGKQCDHVLRNSLMTALDIPYMQINLSSLMLCTAQKLANLFAHGLL